MKTKSILFMVVFLFAANAIATPKSAKVSGTGIPALDVPNVQDAVDNYENVILSGFFDFGTSNVVIHDNVNIHGETDENGSPVTIIYGGMNTFYAPTPEAASVEEPLPPGPVITIKDIHFDGALSAPINIGYTSGVEIKNLEITNVQPVSNFGGGILIRPLDNSQMPAYVPYAVTGLIVVKHNRIDFGDECDPLQTCQGVATRFTTGAIIEITGNTVKQATRNSIEILEALKDENGKGSIELTHNDIATAEEDLGAYTPNGIMVGYSPGFLPADLGFIPPASIKGNDVEANGAISTGILLSVSPGAVVRNNEIVVKDGWTMLGGSAAGIWALWSEDAVIAGNQITIKHSSLERPAGLGGEGILGLSDGLIITRNRIVFNDETAPISAGILQGGSGSTISSNIIKGNGFTAIALYEPGLPEIFSTHPLENMILDNNLEDFINASGYDVAFWPGANDNTLSGKGGVVADFGVDNNILGDWILWP